MDEKDLDLVPIVIEQTGRGERAYDISPASSRTGSSLSTERFTT